MPSCGTAEIETSSDMSERQDSMEGIRAQVEQTGQAREVATPGWRGSLTAARPQVEVHSQAMETRQAGRWSDKDSALSVHPLTLLLELFVTNLTQAGGPGSPLTASTWDAGGRKPGAQWQPEKAQPGASRKQTPRSGERVCNVMGGDVLPRRFHLFFSLRMSSFTQGTR